ncbi:MAG: pyridoxal phosphate-dependent aminotransferase [Candidatus Methanofastidiosia archaeon]
MFKKRFENLPESLHGDEVFRLGEDVLDFSSNVNPLGPSEKVLNFLRKVDRKFIYRYPDSESQKLRKAISEHFDLDGKRIIVTSGSLELLRLTCDLFSGEGKVLIPIPTFSEYERQSILYGKTPIFLKDKGISEILERVGDECKMIFLCNPNNPTGKLLERKKICELSEEVQRKKVLVFLDEAFIEFTDEKSLISENYENLIVSRSMTKLYGLAGLRCGFGIASLKVSKYLRKLIPPWNVSGIAQKAAVVALSDENHTKKTLKLISKEKEYLLKSYLKLGLETKKPFANFFFIDLHDVSSRILKKKMLERGILIRDCSSIRGCGERYVRLSVKKRSENKKMLSTFKKVLEELHG